jgi:hypothetical protein
VLAFPEVFGFVSWTSIKRVSHQRCGESGKRESDLPPSLVGR